MKRYRIIMQSYYMDEEENKYYVDGKHVILEPTKREIEVAKMLGELYGGEIIILPRVNFPLGIKTPDYLVNNERFDLKEIIGTGKFVIEGNLRKKLKQAKNFIIDISNSQLEIKEAEKQIEIILNSKRFFWVEQILIICNNTIIKIYKRKLTANQK